MKKAFSLIELMIVITIIGILAAVAVPSYETYVGRSKIAEAYGLLNDLKRRAIEYYFTNGSWPDAVHLGLSDTNNSIVSPSYYAGTIVSAMQMSNNGGGNPYLNFETTSVGNETLQIRYWLSVSNGTVITTCGVRSGELKYANADCQMCWGTDDGDGTCS